MDTDEGLPGELHPAAPDTRLHSQPIYRMDTLRVSGIMARLSRPHLRHLLSSWKTNLLASSHDGRLFFLAAGEAINVYRMEPFSGRTPPSPDTIFPATPFRVLRPTAEQTYEIAERARPPSVDLAAFLRTLDVAINHLRVGFIGCEECLVAVGGHGLVLVWPVRRLADDAPPAPLVLESDNSESMWGIAMSPNSHLLAVSSNAHRVTLIHVPTRRIVFSEDAVARVHTHNIPSLDMSRCGRWLVSCGIDQRVAVWDLCPVDAEERGLRVRRLWMRVDEWGWLVRFFDSNTIRMGRCGGDSDDDDRMVSKSHYQTDMEGISEEEEELDDLITRHPLSLSFDPALFEDSEGSEGDEDSEEASDRDTVDMDTDTDTADTETDTGPADTDTADTTSDTDTDTALNSQHAAKRSRSTGPREHSVTRGDESDDSVHNLTRRFRDQPRFVDSGDLNGKWTDPLSSIFVNDDMPIANHWSPDLFYLSSASLWILSPDGDERGCMRLAVRDLTRIAVEETGSAITPALALRVQWMERLSMGEWIADLSVFVAVDQSGFLVIVDVCRQSSRQEIVFRAMTVPGPTVLPRPIVGFTVVRVRDAELGRKVHLWTVHLDGTVRLFEVAREWQTDT